MKPIYLILLTGLLSLTSCSSIQGPRSVPIGGCANPRNAPEDIELAQQHAEFLSFLSQNGISCTSAGSIGVTFNVRSNQYPAARKLLMTALLEQPGRWSRLRLDLTGS